MGTKNNPGAYDCYAKAEPDEPMFVLLGRDPVAPALIWLWSVLRHLHDESDKDKEKIVEAQQCAASMMEWGVNHGKKVVGVGQAALAGVLELVKMANYAITESKNEPTGEDFMRMILCHTKISEGNTPETPAGGEAR